MGIDRNQLLKALADAERPLGSADLIERLRLNPGLRTDLKRALREMVRAGEVSREGNFFRLVAPGAQPAPGESAPGRAAAAKPAAGKAATRKTAAGKAGKAAKSTSAKPARASRVAEERYEEPTQAPLLIPAKGGQRGRFQIGILRRHEDGFGFLQPPTGGRGDLYVSAEEARRALDGDLVRVEVVSGFRGRPAARIIEVLERRRSRAVGTYGLRGKLAFVTPSDRALGEPIQVEPSPLAEEGDLVKVAVTRGPTQTAGPLGEVLEVLPAGDTISEVLESAYSQGFSDEFPSDVEREAESFPAKLDRLEVARRRDLRSLRLVTIDGEDARDFDDAVYVEKVRNGWRLVVAIADVSHYVRPEQPLDHEALRRATSAYFPNLVLPMLPERLSNGLCSLQPDQDRLCMVCDMVFEIGEAGARCRSAEIYEGVMRSHARCTYTEVAEVLSGGKSARRESLRGDFEGMEQLARALIAARDTRGSIDFDLPETKVVLDEAGLPLRLEKRERNIAHRIIEEFMLAANEQVARYFSVRGLPSIYRVHGEPDQERLETFLGLARAHGFALKSGEEITGQSLNALLKQIAGSPEQRTLNFLMLRSMMQAVYSPENIGHFGLAAEFYLHFTSPIRRYPDLMVHRLLKEHWARGSRSLGDEEADLQEQHLEGVAARSSERERAAMSAERDIQSFFAALYLKDKVGEEYDATVVAVTDFGLFVELNKEFVEGLVKAESIGGGAELDVERHRLVFDSGLAFTLGNPVKVRVVSVNVEQRHIDFELIEVEGKPFLATVGGRARGRRRPQAAPAEGGEAAGPIVTPGSRSLSEAIAAAAGKKAGGKAKPGAAGGKKRDGGGSPKARQGKSGGAGSRAGKTTRRR